MPLIPNTPLPSYLLVSVGDGQNSSRWTPNIQQKDYAVQGVLAVASGATDYLPPWISFVAGELVSVSGLVRAGSLTADIDLNGSAIDGLTALAFDTTVASYSPTDQTLVNVGDLLAPIIDSVDSADGWSLQFGIWVYL